MALAYSKYYFLLANVLGCAIVCYMTEEIAKSLFVCLKEDIPRSEKRRIAMRLVEAGYDVKLRDLVTHRHLRRPNGFTHSTS